MAGGEQPLFIARRLVRAAVEDIGLADPQAVHQALAAKDVFDFLGSPEGELALAQCVLYLASAPKSNAVYVALGAAKRAAQTHGSLMPPAHILNAPTKLMKNLGYGAGYEYDHNADGGFSGQNYFPDDMPREQFYTPQGNRFRAGDCQAAGLLVKAAGQADGRWGMNYPVLGAVAAGGAIGSALRYTLNSLIQSVAWDGFPFGIFIVNISGGLAMGILTELMALKWNVSQETRAFLTTGILGGYTTFSTFSLDSALLIQRGAYTSARSMWWARHCCRSWRCSPACGWCA